MRSFLARVAPLAVAALLVAVVAARPSIGSPRRAGPKWTSSGPLSADARVIHVSAGNGHLVFMLAQNTGLWKSVDGGDTWSRPRQVPGQALDFEVHPTQQGVLWVTSTKGVFRSTDAGSSWQHLANGIGKVFVSDIAVSPSAPGHLLALRGYPTVVWRSTDGGASWTKSNGGLGGKGVNDLAFDPANPAVAYAATAHGGFKTTNGGGQWSPTALTDYVGHLTTDPNDHLRVYAGGFLGIYRTDDGGTTWPMKTNGFPGGSANGQDIAVDPAAPGVVYAATNWGVYVSSSHGDFWGFDGLDKLLPESLEVDPADDQVIHVATLGAGVFRSDDGGNSYDPHNSGLKAAGCFDIAVAASNPQRIYAAIPVGGGIYTSSNGAQSWTSTKNVMAAALDGEGGYSLAADPTDPLVAYAATGGAVPLDKTTDGGLHWSPASNGLATSLSIDVIQVDPTNPQVVYLGAYTHMFKSTDGGGTWNPIDTGLPTHSGFGSFVTRIAISPSNSQVVYVYVLGGGVFRSGDGGAHWHPRNGGIGTANVYALVVHPNQPGTVYAAASNGGFLYKTTDGGQTWHARTTGLPVSSKRSPSALAIDPASPNVLFTILFERGQAFRTTNGATSWSAFGSRIPRTGTRELEMTPSGKTLYACTVGGVWKLPTG